MSGNTQKPKKTTIVGKVIAAIFRFFGRGKTKKDRQGSDLSSTKASSGADPNTMVVAFGGDPEQEEHASDPILFGREKELAEIRITEAAKLAKEKYQVVAQAPESREKAEEAKVRTKESVLQDINAYGVMFTSFKNELNAWGKEPKRVFNIPEGQKIEDFQTALKNVPAYNATGDHGFVRWRPQANNIFRYIKPVPPKKEYAERSKDPDDKITLKSLNSPGEQVLHVMRCCYHSWRMSVALDNPRAGDAADNFVKNVIGMPESYVKYAFLKSMIGFLEAQKGLNLGMAKGSVDIQKGHTVQGGSKQERTEQAAIVGKANYANHLLSDKHQEVFQVLLHDKIAELTAALKVTEDVLYKPKREFRA